MTWSKARVCFEDTTTLADPNPTCPNAAAHTPSPADHGGYFAWARRMAKTHVQRRCPTCQLYLIWAAKEPCDTCGRLMTVSTDGLIRAHGKPRCPGSRQPPAPPTKE